MARTGVWRWLKRVVVVLVVLLAVAALALGGWALHALRDRSPGYALDLDLGGGPQPPTAGPLRVGFGRVKVNPLVGGAHGPVWVAGFSNNRAATGIHDDLWAVACVVDDGRTRVAMAAIDSIGFMHDDVVAVRQRLAADWKVDYAVVCSTHNHSTPDLMGIWGPAIWKSGVDPAYRELVIAGTAQAIGEAVRGLEPARLTLHDIPTPPEGLVGDTRKPLVFDPDIRVMHFASLSDGRTMGTLVTWANHPETVWSGNTEITADFPGYLREALERGIVHGGKTHLAGLGGIHLYINGAVGGLMTPHPSLAIRDPFLEETFKQPSHEKARALGHQLAVRVLRAVSSGGGMAQENPRWTVRARTIELPVDNPNFLLAPLLGVIDRGHVRWRHIRSEVAFLTLGDASIAAIPGEIYPELVNGGMVRAPGGDFDCDPVEVPPIRELMPGRVKFVFGLANDEIGYIIPRSEWDQEPPYLFDSHQPVYGEINSLGPATAALIHARIRELIPAVGSGGSRASTSP